MTDFQGKPGNTRGANQFSSENVRQQPSGSVQLMPEYYFQKVTSRWISPVVVVAKSDGEVKVCVYLRRANEAIIRECHPILTIGELLLDLNGSTMLSKVDLKWGFRQIFLCQKSRHINRFATQQLLCRYKRLLFGVK